MARKLRRKIGEILIEEGVITSEQLEKALETASGTAIKIGEILQEQGACDEIAIGRALAEQSGMIFVALDGSEGEPTPDLDLIPKDIIQKHTLYLIKRLLRFDT